jgi:hypothetical protein
LIFRDVLGEDANNGNSLTINRLPWLTSSLTIFFFKNKHILQRIKIKIALIYNNEGTLDIPKLMKHYKAYAAKRGFKVFIEKNKKGRKVLKESGLMYSFETFLAAFVEEAEGKSCREADAGLGKSYLIIYLNDKEYLFETKKYYSPSKFKNGKK